MKCTHKWYKIINEIHWCQACGSVWMDKREARPVGEGGKEMPPNLRGIFQPELAFVAETGSAIADLYERVL